MNATSDIQKRREEIVINYFRMADAGNPAVIDLFTEDDKPFYRSSAAFFSATHQAKITP
ncbi:hypothetical protein [Saccharopolyspora oryzae]|uniref:SnoaL-like domain-containing protein n=1 Tax=Saccharopolyspora oryzae TaxID=2997343 RepID=A0ABT4V563_9PSEU|nr:hypothetical protein [Saccharopolyspora oryzae]MDA3628442.1 hypothetical protein [Saccharopolyspora oryzae]